MKFQPVALIFAPGCALLGASIAGWDGAAVGVGVLIVVALAATAVHAWVHWLARDEQAGQPDDFTRPLAGTAPAAARTAIGQPAHLFKRPAR